MSMEYIDQENDKLPDGWQFTPLMQVSNVRTGKKDANHAEVNGKYRFYTCAYEHIMCNTKSFEGECLILPGNGANVGEVFYYNGKFEAYQRTYVIEEIKILPKYLFYHLRYDWKSINADKQYGSATNYIRIGNFENYFVKHPNLPEQKRIVAEIEKQFSRLDEAVDYLKRVKSNLKRYKASVLKAAVEGKLTEEWRKANPDVESADKLLERILADRRKKWEDAELAKMKGKGKVPKDDRWKKKYKEPSQFDESLLPDLPNGWAWAKLPQLGELNRGKSKHRPRNAPILYGGPYPFVQTGDVRHATGIIKQYTQTYSEEGLKQSRLWPKGTLCITIAANIADTALLGFDVCFPDSIVGFIPENENIDEPLAETSICSRNNCCIRLLCHYLELFGQLFLNSTKFCRFQRILIL